MLIKKASLHIYADDNTLFQFATDIDDLIEITSNESQLNQMIVNAEKFQAMFISKNKNALSRNLKLQINNTEITSQPSGELLGFTIDNELKFDQHISRLCNAAGCQLNALFRSKN